MIDCLTQQKGDIIIVTKTNINGQWEGELNGKVGVSRVGDSVTAYRSLQIWFQSLFYEKHLFIT